MKTIIVIIVMLQVLTVSISAFIPTLSLISPTIGTFTPKLSSFISSSSTTSYHQYCYDNNYHKHRKTIITKIFQTTNNDDNGEVNEQNKDIESNIDNDYAFLQDLQKAKTSKLGADIPTTNQQIKDSISNSENEFLNAMKQVKADFQKSKDEVGVDGAIDLLKKDWDEEDRLWEMEKERMGFDDDVNNSQDDGCREDYFDNKDSFQ